MREIPIPDGLEGDALPSGEYVVVVNGHLQTHLGDIHPPTAGALPRWPRCTNVGGFQFAGQAQDHPGGPCSIWNGQWSFRPGVPVGAPGPVIYDLLGILRIADGSEGAEGWQYCDPEKGTLVPGRLTHSHPDFKLFDWTHLGKGIFCGLLDTPNGCGIWDGSVLRKLIYGDVALIRGVAVGENVALTIEMRGGQDARIIWATRDELRALPIVEPPALVLPNFHFTHPVWVVPFKDPHGVSGADAEIIVNRRKDDNPPQDQVVERPYIVAEDSIWGEFQGEKWGVYSEAIDPRYLIEGLAKNTRLVLGHDSIDPWTVPNLRGWDIPCVELYLHTSESFFQSMARWRRETISMLAQHPGDCGVIPMFYIPTDPQGRPLWTEQQILDALKILSEIVNLSPRIKIIAPFAFLRANGIMGHLPFWEAFDLLLAEAKRVGRPILTQVGEVPPPPPPPPPPPKRDCVLSAWGQWHRDSKYPGEEVRERTIVTPAANGGKPCERLIETRDILNPPIEEETEMPINVGQRGMYREFDSTKPFTVAEVTKHQDENLFGVDTVVRGVKKANGKFVHFDAVTGKEDGDRDAAGGEERATFDGRNIMVGRGARGGNTAFEWINL